MAAEISLLPLRPVITVHASLSRRHTVLQGRGLNVCGGPIWERRRRRSAICARRSSSSSPEAESLHVKVPRLTLYELLGISRQVGLPEIKMAYREKARRYHPDANPPSKRDECTKIFLQVQEAYEVLADPDLRADYDHKLRHPLSMQALASGLSSKRRSRDRWSPGVDEKVVNKQAWRAQWEAQVDGLKDIGRKNAGTWSARMHRTRQEAEKDIGDSQ